MSVIRSGIDPCSLPESALLQIYANDEDCYVDSYATDVPSAVDLAEYVAAFYSTWLFKIERAILRYFVSRPSKDAEAVQLGRGQRDRFAAWHVEKRTETQLLMCDIAGRTRSWFMVEPGIENHGEKTRLYFGSAVTPKQNPKTSQRSLGWLFTGLLGFHKLYSRALLSAAKSRLNTRTRSQV